MPARQIDRIATHAHPRPRNQPVIDRIPHRHIRAPRTFAPHVPLSGKARHQILLRRTRSNQRPLRHTLLHRLQILRPRMQKQMHMRIDHPRHQRRISQVDHLRPGRPIHMRPNRNNPIPLHQHLTRRHNPSTRHIQHPRRMQHYHDATAPPPAHTTDSAHKPAINPTQINVFICSENIANQAVSPQQQAS